MLHFLTERMCGECGTGSKGGSLHPSGNRQSLIPSGSTWLGSTAPTRLTTSSSEAFRAKSLQAWERHKRNDLIDENQEILFASQDERAGRVAARQQYSLDEKEDGAIGGRKGAARPQPWDCDGRVWPPGLQLHPQQWENQSQDRF